MFSQGLVEEDLQFIQLPGQFTSIIAFFYYDKIFINLKFTIETTVQCAVL